MNVTPLSHPIVDQPVPRNARWGAIELERLTNMVEQESLFYWKGPQTTGLLTEFKKHYPLHYCFPCSSGSAAIHIALAALRLRPGEEVIVPPITDMGTVIGILYQQAVPVFADLDPRSYNLDPESVRRAVTDKTRAIIAVHLAGNPCDLEALRSLAVAGNIAVIEDCAQAWGAEYRGQPVGLLGDFGCYSFNDFKHLSAGDGGVVGTNSQKLGPSIGKWGDKSYDRVAGETDPALLRDPADLAPNYRISEPQAAVAAAQLTKLQQIVAGRVRAGERLAAQLTDTPGILIPLRHAKDTHTYWFFMIRLELDRLSVDRARFTAELRAEGVAATSGYIPKPVYGYRVFQTHNFFGGAWPVRDFGLTSMDYRRVSCPVAEAILDDCIVMPLNEDMGDDYIDKVALAVNTVSRRHIN